MTTLRENTDHAANLPELLKNVVQDVLELGRAELKVARTEAVQHARTLGRAAILILASLMMIQSAITTLAVLLILMQRSVGLQFTVVAGLAAVSSILAVVGLRIAGRHKLDVGARAKQDAREIMEAVK